jgi:hypothetical protein
VIEEILIHTTDFATNPSSAFHKSILANLAERSGISPNELMDLDSEKESQFKKLEALKKKVQQR